jgi:hypothetical protein
MFKASRIIVILLAHQPHLSEELGDHDDYHARNKPVKRTPCRNRLEVEMLLLPGMKKLWQDNFREYDHGQDHVAAAFDPGQADWIFNLPL